MMADSNVFGIPRIEALTSKNYPLWSMRVGALIRSKHLYDIISEEEPIKVEGNLQSVKAHEEWVAKNDEVCGIIILTLSAQQAMTVRGITNAKELWELLKKRYEGVERQRRTQLKINLARIEKGEKETFEEYLTRAQTISNEMLELGTKIEEHELIGYIIEGLPKKYSEVTTAISSNPDMTYDVMRETLLCYERKYCGTQEYETKAFRSNEIRRIQCHNCFKYGHLARHCWNKQGTAHSRNEGNYGDRGKTFHQDRKFVPRGRGITRDIKNSNKKREYTCYASECAMETKETFINKEKETGDEEMTWTLDSACTSHMTCREDIVINHKEENIGIATAEDNRIIEAKYRGDVLATAQSDEFDKTEIKLTNVLYVPNLNGSLMSVPNLVKKGKQVILDDEGASIYEKNTGDLIAKGTFKNDIFTVKLNLRKKKMENEICLRTNEMTKEILHRRLGHVNYVYLEKMLKKDLVRGLVETSGKETDCEMCIQGKMVRAPFKRIEGTGTTRILEKLHVDLCGPMTVDSLGGNKYILMIVDDYSRRFFVEFVCKKSEVSDKMVNFIERRENETGKHVKSVRSDNGSEFINEPLMNYYKKKGIKAERTTIHSPQSNGVAERANRTVITMARTILIDAGLPTCFWGEAVGTAVYTHNVIPTNSRDKTPMELWTGKKPTIKHLRIFGCKAFYRNDNVDRKKFDVRAKPAIFVGYSRDRRAYRVYDQTERRTRESRDVVFIEESRGYLKNTEKEEKDTEELEYITISPKTINEPKVTDVEEEELSDERNLEETFVDKDVTETFETEIMNKNENTEVKKNHNEKTNEDTRPVRRSSRERKPNPKYFSNIAQEETPKNYEEILLMDDKEKWYEAVKKELNSIEEHKTWKIVDKPNNAKIIRSKWVFRLKREGENLKYKARLVADGSRQRIENADSFSPVMKTESFRTLLKIAAMNNYKTKFFDVEAAYLNATLDNPVYMNPPEGMITEENKVLLVTGSLYGLPEAGRCWYEKLRSILIKLKLEPCKADPCLFVNNDKENYMAIGIYVDDGIIIGKSEDLIRKFLEAIKEEIKIKVSGKKIKFLGLDIETDDNGFLLSQRCYIEEILEKYDMENCRSVKTPGVIGLNLDNHDESTRINMALYQEMLGSIGYLVTGTRPDLAFTISKLSQYAKDPKEIHLQALKRVLRYIQGTKNYKLRIGKGTGKLSVSSDASWCTTQDSKSFGGYTAKIGETLIGWKSNKQKMVTLSTMESELMSLCDAVCEMKWLTSLLEELNQEKLTERPLKIYTDSQSVIDWIKNPRVNNRNKHIARKYHFVKDEREKGNIEVEYINSSELETDIMTKDLSQIIMKKHTDNLGLIEDTVAVRKEELKV